MISVKVVLCSYNVQNTFRTNKYFWEVELFHRTIASLFSVVDYKQKSENNCVKHLGLHKYVVIILGVEMLCLFTFLAKDFGVSK